MPPIDAARDIESAASSGVEVNAAIVARARADKLALIGQYGAMFAQDYGWARPLFPSHRADQRVTFKDLADTADTSLARFSYRYSSHFVHASGRTVELNVLSRAGRGYRVTGPTNIGFAPPASDALDAAIASMNAVVHGVQDLPDPMHLVAVEAMRVLADRALTKFQGPRDGGRVGGASAVPPPVGLGGALHHLAARRVADDPSESEPDVIRADLRLRRGSERRSNAG